MDFHAPEKQNQVVIMQGRMILHNAVQPANRPAAILKKEVFMKKNWTTMLCVFVLAGFCHSASAYTLRLQWVPQTQFAGYYMAKEKGFYDEQGIELDVLPAEPGMTSLRELLSGGSDFATAWLLSSLILRANGEKLVQIGQFFQKPALMLVAKKESGIKSVQDFPGHVIGVWEGEFQVPPKALIRKYRLRDVKVVPQGYTMTPFLEGKVDIASAMRYNEYFQLMEDGMDESGIIVFDYVKLGLNMPEDGIYVRETFYETHKEVCRKFIRASVKGWKYAFSHKEETVSLITAIANQTEYKTTAQKQKWMLDVVEGLMEKKPMDKPVANDSASRVSQKQEKPDPAGCPWNIALKKEDFERAVQVLKDIRMIQSLPVYGNFFKDIPQ